jgi:hypothetical protein
VEFNRNSISGIANPFAQRSGLQIPTSACVPFSKRKKGTSGAAGENLPSINNLKSYKLYPNPNDGNMLLEYELNESEIGYVLVYSIVGNLVYSSQLKQNKRSAALNLQNVDSGIYFVKVSVNDNTKLSIKVVIIKE